MSRYAYSLKPNPWEWLTSKEKAEAMAEKVTVVTTLCVSSRGHKMSPWQVARWRDDYGIDGIDLDLEEGAGSKKVNI